jgi:hypothetical protein
VQSFAKHDCGFSARFRRIGSIGLTYSFAETLSTSFGTLTAGDAFAGFYTIDMSLPPVITGGSEPSAQ